MSIDEASEVQRPSAVDAPEAPPAPTYALAERRRVLQALFPRASRRFRYGVLLALSVTIATGGLLADSPAVVIGAMIVAPIMGPIQAMAGSIALGRGRRFLTELGVVGASVAGSVAIAWTITAIVPGAQITSEVLARTSPGVLDLLVALAAGTAGAYAVTRADISDALPGVAIAVALAPPLSAVGICLQLGRSDLASGALLLFVTNLLAITLSGVLVLFATGFVPWTALRDLRPGSVAAFIAVLVAMGIASIPLVSASVGAADRALERRQASEAVEDWLGPSSSLQVERVSIDDTVIRVELAGPIPPPATTSLTDRVRSIVPGARVDIRWDDTSDDEAAGNELSDPDAPGGAAPDESDGPTLPEQSLQPLIDSWLGEQREAFDVLATVVDAERVVIDLVGEVEPPPADLLGAAVTDAAGRRIAVEVRWVPRVVLRSSDDDPAQRALALATDAAVRWAQDRTVSVADVRLEDGVVLIDLTGPSAPEVLTLVVEVRRAWEQGDLPTDQRPTIDVGFTPRERLGRVGG